jgi:hypothetical protein
MVAIVSVPGVEALGKALEEGNGDFLRRVLLAAEVPVQEVSWALLGTHEATGHQPGISRTPAVISRYFATFPITTLSDLPTTALPLD